MLPSNHRKYRTLTFYSGPAIVHLMLAAVRDFAKTERELVRKETRFGQAPPVKGHELSEASVTLLIKAVTQMKC